ncbi:hypothetical protein L227DRAFT_581755 [Lentinus tigrinus ALCF2SS1-6]|uniref:Uncharacterized protein n=1 Tax=Lentinus tigrinus ALCF2SS1-6 TaxID=1328759 RepID=A0A5C2RPB1_9APHY|nr:hypothetical protein L227DRAFT_581755 [Lentinus tigrinus ALCF2SS1-6]
MSDSSRGSRFQASSFVMERYISCAPYSSRAITPDGRTLFTRRVLFILNVLHLVLSVAAVSGMVCRTRLSCN